MDVVNALFRCKLAFALKTEAEYHRRIPNGSYVDEYCFEIRWAEKTDGIKTDEVRSLAFESVANVLNLLVMKLAKKPNL